MQSHLDQSCDEEKMRCYRQKVLKGENYPNIVAKSNQHKFVQSTKCNRNDSLEVRFTNCCSLQTHAAVFLALTLFITMQRLTGALALCPQLEQSRAQARAELRPIHKSSAKHPALCTLQYTLRAGQVEFCPDCLKDLSIPTHSSFVQGWSEHLLWLKGLLPHQQNVIFLL